MSSPINEDFDHADAAASSPLADPSPPRRHCSAEYDIGECRTEHSPVNSRPPIPKWLEKGLPNLIWQMLEGDKEMQDFILLRSQSSKPEILAPPIVQRSMTPALAFMLSRTAKDNVPFTDTACSLDAAALDYKLTHSRAALVKKLLRCVEHTKKHARALVRKEMLLAQQTAFLFRPLISDGLPEAPSLSRKVSIAKITNRDMKRRRCSSSSSPASEPTVTPVPSIGPEPSRTPSSGPASEPTVTPVSSMGTPHEASSSSQVPSSRAPEKLKWEVGAIVCALAISDGGGHTGRIYGCGITTAEVVGAPSTRHINGVPTTVLPLKSPSQQRPIYWPVAYLRQASISISCGGKDLGSRTRQPRTSTRTREQNRKQKQCADSRQQQAAVKNEEDLKVLGEELEKVKAERTAIRQTQLEQEQVMQQQMKEQKNCLEKEKELRMEAQAAVMDLEHRVIRTTAQLGEERRQGNQQRQKQREEETTRRINAEQTERSLGYTRGLLHKGAEELSKMEGHLSKMEDQRNKARREKRSVKKEVATYKRLVAAANNRANRAERSKEASEADVISLVDENGELESKLTETMEALLQMRKLLSPAAREELDFLVDASKEVDTEQTVSLIAELGKKGERWSQDIIELGMELMEKGLTAPQAEQVTRAFVAFQHPDKVEGKDYRIPAAARFKEWRSFLAPICNFLAVSIIRLAVRVHLLHDATTKDGISVFQTAARVELKDPDSGSIQVVEFPVKFDLLPTGDAVTEAKLMQKSLHSDLGSGVHASLLTVDSASSDNAARKTSCKARELKVGEVDQLKAMSDEALRQAPDELAHAAQAWLQMTETQRSVAHNLHELGCTGHSVNLTIEDSHKKTEKSVLEANVVRDLAVNVIQRFFIRSVQNKEGYMEKRWWMKKIGVKLYKDDSEVTLRFSAGEKNSWVKVPQSEATMPELEGGGKKKPKEGGFILQFNGHGDRQPRLVLVPSGKHVDGTDLPNVSEILITLSKAFSSHGNDALFYLNESKHLGRWAEVNSREMKHVPSRKGSRQGWTLAVGTAAMFNASVWTDYMDDVRADDAELNQLIDGSWNGVRDKYFVASVSARSFVDVTFAIPLNYFVHSDFVGRHEISSVMSCAKRWIEKLGELDSIGTKPPPGVESLSELILEKHEGWREAYDKWFKVEGKELEAAHKLATGTDRWHHVSAHLFAAHGPMIATHLRNLDGDCSMYTELKHAPKVTDLVEAGFGCFDYALTKTKSSVESSYGVGHAMKMHAMANPEELRRKAERAVANKRRSNTGDDPEALLKNYFVTSWKLAISREERWKVLKDLQKNLRTHGKERQATRVKCADAALDRKKASVKKGQNRRLKRIVHYLRYDKVTAITTAPAMDKLKREHSDYLGNYAEALRDQIRVRIHVYFITETPAIGSGSSDGEMLRLEEEVTRLVLAVLPTKPACPLPEYRPEHAAPTPEAVSAQKEAVKKTIRAYRELIALTERGIFRLPRDDDCDGEKRRSTRSGGGRPSKKRRKSGIRKIKKKESDLIGQSFEDDGTNWKVLDVAWSDEVIPSEVVVYYYDIELVASEGIIEEDLLASLEEAGGHHNIEHVEYSLVSEVTAWLRLGASKKP